MHFYVNVHFCLLASSLTCRQVDKVVWWTMKIKIMHLRWTISDNNQKQEKTFPMKREEEREVEEGGAKWSKVEDKEVLPLSLLGIETLFKLFIKIYLLFHNEASIKISRKAAVMQFNYITAVFSLVYQLKQHKREQKRKQGRVEWFRLLKDTRVVKSWWQFVHFDVKSTTREAIWGDCTFSCIITQQIKMLPVK